MNRIIQAIAFAAEKHRNQRRKDADASPYINHPIALANVLANEAGIADEKVLIAAILHDTIEDTETTAEELAEAFGEEIADIVFEVTDDKALPKAERKRLQIVNAPSSSKRAKLVSWPIRYATCATFQSIRRHTGAWSAVWRITTGPRPSSTACTARTRFSSDCSTRHIAASPDFPRSVAC